MTQRNGHPGHPQTQGKIDRFHQALKRWLAARPHPATLSELQELLDAFRVIYNTERSHRAHPHHLTPEQAYLARPKATPGNQPAAAIRVRTDIVDQFGELTLRHRSRLHHLGIGRAHACTPVLILITASTVTVISKTGHHTIATHHNYWPDKQKNPGKSRGNL
ncbi:integrase core domain-containing protein [Mycobacterium sp. UM_Kg1]|uniref:integrase core domain-containing protein n=1 Tax=Mycobacterium sp. UM_Kg1 TaxID=1545691 RepID=UPI003369CCA6